MIAFEFAKKFWKYLNLYNNNIENRYHRTLYIINFIVVVFGLIIFIALSSLYLVEYFMDQSEIDNQFILYILMQISLDLSPLGTLICAIIGKNDIKNLIESIDNILEESEYLFNKSLQWNVAESNF